MQVKKYEQLVMWLGHRSHTLASNINNEIYKLYKKLKYFMNQNQSFKIVISILNLTIISKHKKYFIISGLQH